MRKSVVIKIVLALTAAYFVIQFTSFKNLFIKRSVGEDRADKGWEVLLDLVYVFTRHCRPFKIPVFVIEPSVLLSVVTVTSAQPLPECSSLCQAGDVISLGVFQHDWQNKGSLERNLQESGLVMVGVSSPDPRQLSVQKTVVPSIPTHYFIHQSTNIRPLIHLVVFYTRADNFLWHSQLETTNKTSYLSIVPDRISFAGHAGAYDRFPLRSLRIDGIGLHLPHTVKEFLIQVPHSTFIECDYRQARTFLRKYPQDDSEDAQKFKRKGRQLLANAKEILDDLGIPFWLSSGTCLGWYRQCDIITYGKDIDFGIWIKDHHEDVVNAFESRGFALKHVFGKESDSYELSFKAGEIKLDLFFFYEEDTYMWNGGTEVRTGQKYKYYFPKFRVCWTEFLDLRVRVPCPTLPYVIANYGKRWNVPVTTWDWKKSPSNVKENGIWPKHEWNEVMQIYE